MPMIVAKKEVFENVKTNETEKTCENDKND